MLGARLEPPAIRSTVSFGGITDGLVADARAAGMGDPQRVATALIASYLGAAVLAMSSARARPLVEILAPMIDAVLGEEDDPKPVAPAGGRVRGRRAPRPA